MQREREAEMLFTFLEFLENSTNQIETPRVVTLVMSAKLPDV